MGATPVDLSVTYDNGAASAVDRSVSYDNGAASAVDRSVTFSNVAAIEGNNLLRNPRFDLDATSWAAYSAGGGTCTLTWNAGGWGEFAWTVGGTNEQMIQSTVTNPVQPILAGTQLRVRFRAKASASLTLPRAYLYQAGDGAIANFNASPFVLTTDFQDFESAIVAAAFDADAIFSFILEFPPSTTGTVHLDNVVLEVIPSGVSNPMSNTAPTPKTWPF